MQLKDIEQPSHKELVEGQQIFQTSPEVAEVEMMETREKESKEPAQVSIEII
jgi:hypothetical protein